MFSQFRIPRIPAFSLALALVLQTNAAPRQDEKTENSPAQHAMGTRQKVNGIPNFGQVSETLYRGALPNTAGLEALKKMGVNIVIDMRRGHDQLEEDTVAKLGMQYMSIPSRCPFPQDEPVARFLAVIEQNRDKKVFVHCRLGEDRTGLAVAAYRIAEQGWSADEADNEMKAFGFSTMHEMICPGLQTYEETFPERLKKNPAFHKLSPQNGTAK
jgi:protein tyrosine/serine phosphatase